MPTGPAAAALAALALVAGACRGGAGEERPAERPPGTGAQAPEAPAQGQEAPPEPAFPDDERVVEMVLAVNAHITVLKRSGDFADYRRVEEVARRIDPEVVGVQPFALFEVRVVAPGAAGDATVVVKGVDPARRVLPLERYLTAGSLDDLAAEVAPGQPAPALVGAKLARARRLAPGETLTLAHAPAPDAWVVSDPDARLQLRVAGILDMRAGRAAPGSDLAESIADEYDGRFVFTSLAAAQEMAGRGDVVLGIELTVKDPTRAGPIGDRLQAKLGPGYHVLDWCELNPAAFRDRCAALGRLPPE